MTEPRIVTCWYRITERDMEFNHVSDGYDPGAFTPTPACEYQRIAWHGARWEGIMARVFNGHVCEYGELDDGPIKTVRWT